VDADEIARAEGNMDPDMFSPMRRGAKTRLALFKEYPWIYNFTYATARQVIFWISHGYPEERLHTGETDADELEQGFEKWIDVPETLLKDEKQLRKFRTGEE
jgi:hypothetical protein